MTNLITILSALSRIRQWQIGSVFAVMLLIAFLEIATIGSIAPLIAIAISRDTQGADTMPYDLPWIDGLSSAFALAALVIIITGLMRLVLLFLSQSLLMKCARDLRAKLFSRAVHTPFKAVLTRNSADVLNGVGRAETFVGCVLDPILLTLANGTLVLAIGTFLFWLAPGLTLLGAAVLFVLYGGITKLIGPRIARNSRETDAATIRTIKTMQEASGGMREVILHRLRSRVIEQFRKSDHERLSRAHNTTILTSAPPLVIDTARMLAIAGIVVLEAETRGGLMANLPLLSALALGALRALPAVSNTWAGIAAVKANTFAIDALASDLRSDHSASQMGRTHQEPLGLTKEIAFENVSFGYDPDKPVLHAIDFTLARGEHLGIEGPTGSGKSTLLDLMSGLISPDEGRIRIDDTVLDEHTAPAWQRCLAYVPQVVYLNDATIAANIALSDEYDEDRLLEAARIACLLDFIEKQPAGLHTLVGERGVRLSGGQRQRIGIARAVHLRPELLILDEATSALDSETEKSVMQAVSSMDHRPTIVTVAHRQSTLAYCSKRLHLSQEHKLMAVRP